MLLPATVTLSDRYRNDSVGVLFPNQEDLEQFKDLLVSYDHPYLPPLDERWSGDMFAMVQLVQLFPGCSDDIAKAAAHLFFTIIKNHRRPDGNKRSALCCYILLLALNGKASVVMGDELEELAVTVASSHGNSEEEVLPMPHDLFFAHMKDVA